MKILIKPGQVVQVSIYNVLFLNADNINESHHFTGFYLFLFYSIISINAFAFETGYNTLFIDGKRRHKGFDLGNTWMV